MATKVNSITAEESVPDLIIGGNIEENRFRSFTKAILTAFINNLISIFVTNRKNGISLTGITGNTITNSALAGRGILLAVIDDQPYNLNFAKTGANDAAKLASSSVIFQFDLRPDQKVTLLFE
jgi:hypothetical protein